MDDPAEEEAQRADQNGEITPDGKPASDTHRGLNPDVMKPNSDMQRKANSGDSQARAIIEKTQENISRGATEVGLHIKYGPKTASPTLSKNIIYLVGPNGEHIQLFVGKGHKDNHALASTTKLRAHIINTIFSKFIGGPSRQKGESGRG
jgi:hypothetical protein